MKAKQTEEMAGSDNTGIFFNIFIGLIALAFVGLVVMLFMF